MRAILLMAFPLALGLAVACGGSDTGGNNNGNGNAAGADDGSGDGNTAGTSTGNEQGVSLEELPAKYGAAVCEVFTSCAGDLFSLFRPGEDCSKTTKITVEEGLAPLMAAIDAGRVKYHPSKVQACVDDIAAAGCEQLTKREPVSCQEALEGTVAQGGDCTLDAECSGAQYCKVGDACPGKCAPYAAAGEECKSNDNCRDGLSCDDNGHCVAPSKVGELCQQGEPDCGPGLLCLGDDSTAGTPGKCYTPDQALTGKLGDACSFTAGTLCAADYSCEINSVSPIGGECVAKVAADAACHVAIPDECPVDQYCKLGADPLDAGVCTAKPVAGEKCAKGLGTANICAPYLRCDNGLCREIAHAGEDCTQNDTCYSNHCVEGACVTGNSCE